MKIKDLTTVQDFADLKKGDFVACEFHRDVNDFPKKYRFNVFKIALNKAEAREIILQKKNNIYFNYEMFIAGESNLKSATLISQ